MGRQGILKPYKEVWILSGRSWKQMKNFEQGMTRLVLLEKLKNCGGENGWIVKGFGRIISRNLMRKL